MSHPLVIAEVGLNHDGSYTSACDHIEAAVAAGADIVKFQKRSDPWWFQNTDPRPPGRFTFGSTYGAHRAALEFTAGQHHALATECELAGVGYCVSVWDAQAVVDVRGILGWLKIGRPTAVSHRLREILAASRTSGRHGFLVSCRNSGEEYAARRLVEQYDHTIQPMFCPGSYPDTEPLPEVPDWACGVSFHAPHAKPFVDAVSHFADIEYERIGKRDGAVYNPQTTYVEAHFALDHVQHSDKEYSLNFDQLKSLCDYAKLRRSTNDENIDRWLNEKKEVSS